MAMQGYGFDPNLPPELDAESQRIAKQQAIAEAMLSRSMAPLPTNQGRLHWTQALAQVVNARQGRVDMDAAAKDRAGLGAKYQEGLAGEVSRIAALRRGTPTTENIVDEQANDGEGAPAQIVTPGRPASQGQITDALMASTYPSMKQAGMARMAQEPAMELKREEGRETREARLHERILSLDAQSARSDADRASRDKAATEAAALRRELATMQDETRRAIAGSRSTVNVNPAVTVTEIVRDGRVVKIDARSGRELGESPKESDAQKRDNKRAFNMQGIGASIQQAEDLLGGVVRREDGSVDPTKKGALPTGSGIGNVADKAMGIFGASTAGGDMAAKLRSVGGALVSKMPRMEGPQSDKDVALYKEMAGMVGDANVPRSQRLAALDEVKRLWAKYERLNPDAFAGGKPNGAGGAAPAGVDPAVWNAMTPQERALWK